MPLTAKVFHRITRHLAFQPGPWTACWRWRGAFGDREPVVWVGRTVNVRTWLGRTLRVPATLRRHPCGDRDCVNPAHTPRRAK